MNKHARNLKHEPEVRSGCTPSRKPFFRTKRQILGYLAIAAVTIGMIGLSSCAGVTSAGSGAPGANTSAPGTGILSPNSNSLNFGNVALGSIGTQSVIVTNTGTASVDISQATVSGSGFTVMSGNSSSIVAIGQAVTVQVQFAPQTAGAASGSLSVMSNAPSATLTISLAGMATQATLSISPASLSFNNIVVGQTSTQSVTLTNNGNASLTLTAAKVTGAGFATSGLSLPVTLNAGQGTSFNVQFAPTTTNASSGSIGFTENATGSPQTLTMSGSAVNPSSTLSAYPGTVNFSNIVVGSTGTQTVSLKNTGGAAVTITQVSPAGTGFGVTGLTVGQTIAAGASASFHRDVYADHYGSCFRERDDQ